MKHGGVMAIPKWDDQSKCRLDGSRLAGDGRGSMTCSMRIIGREERRAARPSSWQRGNRCQQGGLQDQDDRQRGTLRIRCVKTPTCSLRSSGEAWFLPGEVSRVAGDLGSRSVGGRQNKLPPTPYVPVPESPRRPWTRLKLKLPATPCAASPSRSCPANWDTQERRRIPQPCPTSALLFGISEYTKYLGCPGPSAQGPGGGRARGAHAVSPTPGGGLPVRGSSCDRRPPESGQQERQNLATRSSSASTTSATSATLQICAAAAR